MAEGLNCTIVTPSASLFSEPADYVNLPAWDGQLGVMPQTSPFLTQLGTGILTVHQGTDQKRFAVGGGFAQMQGGALTLLADQAIGAESIDATAAQQELASIEAKLAEDSVDSVREREALDRARRFAFTKLSLARR